MAEGVETPVRHDFLVSIGCDACRGYFFGRPVVTDELAAFVVPGQAA